MIGKTFAKPLAKGFSLEKLRICVVLSLLNKSNYAHSLFLWKSKLKIILLSLDSINFSPLIKDIYGSWNLRMIFKILNISVSLEKFLQYTFEIKQRIARNRLKYFKEVSFAICVVTVNSDLTLAEEEFCYEREKFSAEYIIQVQCHVDMKEGINLIKICVGSEIVRYISFMIHFMRIFITTRNNGLQCYCTTTHASHFNTNFI